MNLEDERELMRQGNDRRAPGLASKALLPAWVNGAAANAAVPGRRLLDRGTTSRAGADLERSGLLETVSDPQCFLQLSPVPAETVSPSALLIMLAARGVSSIGRAYPHCSTEQRISWGKNPWGSTRDEGM